MKALLVTLLPLIHFIFVPAPHHSGRCLLPIPLVDAVYHRHGSLSLPCFRYIRRLQQWHGFGRMTAFAHRPWYAMELQKPQKNHSYPIFTLFLAALLQTSVSLECTVPYFFKYFCIFFYHFCVPIIIFLGSVCFFNLVFPYPSRNCLRRVTDLREWEECNYSSCSQKYYS